MNNSERVEVESNQLKIKEAVFADLGILLDRRMGQLDSRILTPLLSKAGKKMNRTDLVSIVEELRNNDTDRRFRRLNIEGLVGTISTSAPLEPT